MNGFIAFMLIRCTQKTGTPTALPHIVSAPESALGSHPCVALSSAQVNSILHQVETLPKGRFLLEATNPISGRFLLEATGFSRTSDWGLLAIDIGGIFLCAICHRLAPRECAGYPLFDSTGIVSGIGVPLSSSIRKYDDVF